MTDENKIDRINKIDLASDELYKIKQAAMKDVDVAMVCAVYKEGEGNTVALCGNINRVELALARTIILLAKANNINVGAEIALISVATKLQQLGGED